MFESDMNIFSFTIPFLRYVRDFQFIIFKNQKKFLNIILSDQF